MKASRFVKAFEKTVDTWERALSLILECIEMILTVQRQWMYLEVRERKKKAEFYRKRLKVYEKNLFERNKAIEV